MKKYIFIGFLTLSAFAQDLPPQNPPSNNKLYYTLDGTYRLDGRQYMGEHNFQLTHKFDDSFKMSAQIDFYTNYQYNNDRQRMAGYLKERYARLKFTGAPFVKFAGFNTGWEIRYYMPVDDYQQKAGSFGYISPRFVMSREYNAHFNLTILPKGYLDFQRKSYQVNSSAQQTNEIFGLGIEVIPQWVISPGFTLTYDPEVIASVQGTSPTQHQITEIFYYDHDVELMYNLKSFYNWGIAALWKMDYYYFGNHVLQDNPEGEVFKGVRQKVGFRLAKTFDL